MTTTTTEGRYALGRSPEEYERLRTQARVWEVATGRLLDQVGLAAGATCLDAGCGPGETMRLMAHRVGPAGQVTGIDIDAGLGAQAQTMLHEAGHRQCRFLAHDLTTDAPVPGGPFDLVYARLLLFHLPARLTVLRRLWDAVAPGGHLVVHDYDMNGVSTTLPLATLDELLAAVNAGFTAAGCDIRMGMHLPDLFVTAGIGAPDGTDVAGRLQPLAEAGAMLDAVYRSLLPVLLGHRITTPEDSERALAAFGEDRLRHADRSAMLPLLVGAWKRKPHGDG
jgi:ubiquinone/menaquinone biosynthesis C-methylase UbiE